jgi:2-polyprenyl-3-methyl-5-hydroxy-6-metoxy-1,4-benzoquinol methylase
MKNQNIETINCCICNNNKPKKLKRIRFRNHSLRLVKCKKCDLMFFSPRLSEEYLKILYCKDHFDQLTNNQNYIKEDFHEFRKRLKLINKYLKNKTSVLDIGCCTGNFLISCKNNEFKTIIGIDINKKTNEYCKKLGFKIYEKLPKRKFDLIHLSDIIEHIGNPNSFIKKTKKNLNKEGIIVLTTPNINNPINHLVNIKPDQHLFYFSKKSISKLLKKNGFDIITIKRWNRFHPLKNLINTTSANKIRHFLKIIMLLKLDFIVDELILKNLYTDLLVIAKKN